jgi:hypothetical protein
LEKYADEYGDDDELDDDGKCQYEHGFLAIVLRIDFLLRVSHSSLFLPLQCFYYLIRLPSYSNSIFPV